MHRPTWMVRANAGGSLASEFKVRSLVAIGWREAGNVLSLQSREEFVKRMWETYPEESKGMIINASGQVFRMVCDMKIGDQIVTYDNARRMYLIGKIVGEAQYDESLFEKEFPLFRKVDWVKEISRDDLSLTAKNSLGSTLTLFKVPSETVAEIEALMRGMRPPPETDEEPLEENLLQDIQGKSREFIKDKISRLDWDQMQQITAGLLRSMGYKTRISPSGPDRGKDIVASPDGFGFQQPRIIVEVKHRKGQMGSQEVRSFLAVIRHDGDKGLYVSTGGFSREAYYEAERAAHPITLMDLDGLVEAILEHYENMDLEARVLLPLVRLYWPA